MKNHVGNGIFCDYCGSETVDVFVYYSFDFIKVAMVNKNFLRVVDNDVCSIDICSNCIELFKKRLLQIANKIPEKPTRCDVTGKDFSNDSVFYKCSISKVSVDVNKYVLICSSCNEELNDGDVCKCGSNEVFREAKVDVDDKYLELNFCSDIFAKFIAHVNYVKNIGDKAWTG